MTHPTIDMFLKAKQHRSQWDPILKQAYAYALPHHTPFSQNKDQQAPTHVFDNTAINAIQWKKARLHGQLFPPFQQWMDFRLPIRGKNLSPQQKNDIDIYLQEVKEKFHDAIEASNFHIEMGPALGDACISTGCLMIHQGSPSRPLRFEAIPIDEFIPQENNQGLLNHVFRQQIVSKKDIHIKWNDIPNEKIQHINDENSIFIIEAFLKHQDATTYEVWMHENNQYVKLITRQYEALPAVAFRMDKAPAQSMGHGPVLNALADIKTANKVVELTLKNASIAVTGIWQADDDGVMNFSNVKLTPGAIIPKAQGSKGLQPLQAPGKFDVSQIILAQLQESIRRAILGSTLPPADQTHKTALEIGARISEHQSVEIPMMLRILNELDAPLTKRVLHILAHPAMAGSDYHIQPFQLGNEKIMPIPVSPLVRLQQKNLAQETFSTFLNLCQNFPKETQDIIQTQDYLKDFLKKNAFPAQFFKNQNHTQEKGLFDHEDNIPSPLPVEKEFPVQFQPQGIITTDPQ